MLRKPWHRRGLCSVRCFKNGFHQTEQSLGHFTLLSANPDDGATAVAANASANYLGSDFGSALGGLVFFSPTFLVLGALGTVGLAGLCQLALIKHKIE